MGYPDFLRTQQQDTILDKDLVWPNSQTTETGVYDVKEYQYVDMYVLSNGDLQNIGLRWWLDQAGIYTAGSQYFTLDHNIIEPMFLHIPAVSQYFSLELNANATSLGGGSGYLWASNRNHPHQVVPGTYAQVLAYAVIQAAGQAFLYPQWAVDGPAILATLTDIGDVQYVLQGWAEDLGSQDLLSIEPAGGAWVQTNIILPVGAWRLLVYNNNAGNATIYATVTASPTGSS